MERKKMNVLAQVLSSLGVSMGFFVLGTTIGYPTKALPQLVNGTDPNVSITEEEGSWFATILPISGGLLTPFGGTLSAKFGRKMVILCSAPNVAIGWLLLYFATNRAMLLAGRLITCIFVSFYVSSVGVYISETVHPDLRGKLVVLSPFFLALGILMDWTIGYFYTWRTIALNAFFSCAFLTLTMLILPETPYWLIEKNQIDRAKKSLQFFRGKNYDISAEIQEIHQKHLSKGRSQSWRWIIKRISSSVFFKPFSCIGIIYLLFAMTGFDVLTVYMIPILQETGSGIDPKIGPMIAGLARVLSAGMMPFLMGKMSPKLQFALGQFISSVCIACLGLFAYLDQDLAWLPLTMILSITLMRSMATLPVMHTLLMESYPTEIRTQSIGLTESLFLIFSAINLKIYPNVLPLLGFQGISIFYAFIGITMTLWGLYRIPDNRGKSLVKVEEFYEERNKV